MRLQHWAGNRWLRPHQTTPSQIADHLDSCRAKRNTAEYDAAGTITQSEATELRSFTRELRIHVLQWLRDNHPSLIAP